MDSVVGAPGARGYDVVRVTPAGSRPFELWLDTSRHLLARLVERADVGVSVVTFGDYRKVGPFVLPFLIRQGDGDAQFDKELRVDRYDVDAALPEGRFSLPSSPALDLHLPAGKISTKVALRIADDHPVIPIRINGKGPFDALLDTGGAASVTPDVAAAVGIAAVGAIEGDEALQRWRAEPAKFR